MSSSFVFADTGGTNPRTIDLANPLGVSDVSELITKIINFLIVVAAPIVAGMIIIGAYQMMFAGGDPEKFKLGKKTILYAVIGYTIILLSGGVALIIKSVLGSGS